MKDTGRIAFPDQGRRMDGDGRWAQDWSQGMSLRDYFAGQALAGFLGNCTRDLSNEAAAEDAYASADAMIVERDKT